MKVYGLLLQRHSGKADEYRHDGRVAVDTRNTRSCSDGFEIGCDNGVKVRVAFSLDCCDREAMGFVATTAGVSDEDVRDLMTATVEHRFGRVNRLPATIKCPSRCPFLIARSCLWLRLRWLCSGEAMTEVFATLTKSIVQVECQDNGARKHARSSTYPIAIPGLRRYTSAGR